jgi:class 3 adenylate cyclase/CheY-like chemotaxis protein
MMIHTNLTQDRGTLALMHSRSGSTPKHKSTVYGSSLPKTKILIAEATSDSLPELPDDLANLGYDLVVATSGSQVLEQVKRTTPVLVILDINLPELGGYHLCEMLKMDPKTRPVPVLFMGSATDTQARDRAFGVGGVDYILKPFSTTELLARIRNQLTLLNLHRRVVDQQILRADPATSTMPLLASLQKRLREQSTHLQSQNDRLQREILERQQVEIALREEQEKSEQLLLNVLPATVAQKLKQGEEHCAERFEEATILFADIVNFTPFSAELPPLELVNLLNEIFSAFDRLAQSLGLEKIKTIGDAYMVAGGVPSPCANHAEAVMEMAIAMRQEIRQFKQPDLKPLRLRIGINTGTVVAGVIGLRKFSYDLWGDAVNVASRMESQGLPGRIQVTEATYRLLAHRYEFEQWGKVNIKGKGEMITYLLVGRKSHGALETAQ